MTVLAKNIGLLVTTEQLTIILIITASIFAIFIVVAVVKMYKLKAENRRLLESNPFEGNANEPEKDYEGGHLYES